MLKSYQSSSRNYGLYLAIGGKASPTDYYSDRLTGHYFRDTLRHKRSQLTASLLSYEQELRDSRGVSAKYVWPVWKTIERLVRDTKEDLRKLDDLEQIARKKVEEDDAVERLQTEEREECKVVEEGDSLGKEEDVKERDTAKVADMPVLV